MSKTKKAALKQPASITADFPSDTESEHALVDLARSLTTAASLATALSNDGRISSSKQATFWDLSSATALFRYTINDLWFKILEIADLSELRKFGAIAEAAKEACAAAYETPNTSTILTAFEALGAANDAVGGLLQRAASA